MKKWLQITQKFNAYYLSICFFICSIGFLAFTVGAIRHHRHADCFVGIFMTVSSLFCGWGALPTKNQP